MIIYEAEGRYLQTAALGADCGISHEIQAETVHGLTTSVEDRVVKMMSL